jgi:hypothetical protein
MPHGKHHQTGWLQHVVASALPARERWRQLESQLEPAMSTDGNLCDGRLLLMSERGTTRFSGSRLNNASTTQEALSQTGNITEVDSLNLGHGMMRLFLFFIFSPIYKKHKAKIKCARSAGAGYMPELLRTDVQLGRGNHHPAARCAWSLYLVCGRAVGPQVPEDPLAGQSLQLRVLLAHKFAMNPRGTIETRKARSGLWRWCTRVLWLRVLVSPRLLERGFTAKTRQ